MKRVKFKVISKEDFTTRYPEALAELEHETSSYGEVKVPGHGWCACVVTDGSPSVFYDEDDGWQSTPEGTKFEQV